jgi:holin-like protein
MTKGDFMKIGLTILQISLLYGIYYIGVLIQTTLELSIPGSIIGMLILFLLLTTKLIKEKWLSMGGNLLLSNLAILFVPATVGIIDYLPFFKGKGFLTLVIALLSTVIVLYVSGVISQFIATKQELKRSEHERSLEG